MSNEAATDATAAPGPRPGFARAALYVFLICLYTLVFGIPCFLLALLNPRGGASYNLSLVWARLILRTCGVRVASSGIENLPVSGPFIIMSTHNSHFDIPVLMQEIPQQLRIVGKKSLFKIPVFGWYLSAAGYVCVDRDSRTQAFDSLNRAADMVGAGMPLLIFPEGTRSPGGGLGPFKKGGFVVALKAQVPIIPVVIAGTYHVLPKTTWRISPGAVRVVFGKPIATTEFTYETREKLMEEVRRAMKEIKEAKIDLGAPQ